MKINLSDTIIAAIVSSLISVLISFFLTKKDELASLDSQLDSILKISIEYPYLESTDFTWKWHENNNSPDEKYRRYENYATLVFNYLSRVCSHFHYKKKKILAYIDINGWIKIHKDYWHNPTISDENETVYDKKFKSLVHEILGGIKQ